MTVLNRRSSALPPTDRFRAVSDFMLASDDIELLKGAE